MKPHAPQPLNYQNPAAAARRPRVRARWWVAAACLVAVALTAWSLRGPWRAFTVERALRRMMAACRTDSPPADTVAYEDDVARAATINRQPGYISFNGWDGLERVGRAPREWFDLRFRTPDGWHWAPDDPILFLHELKTPGGPERLVVVHAKPTWPGKETRVQVWAMTLSLFDAPDFAARLEDDSYDGVELVDVDRTGGKGLRIYAGQSDPNDAAHFTVDYEVDGVRGTIDGRLTADGSGGARVVTTRVTTRGS